MTNAESKRAFIESTEGIELRKQLESMVKSPHYNTRVYSLVNDTDGSKFVDKHMNYMSTHRNMNAAQYLSNVKLMTKIVK